MSTYAHIQDEMVVNVVAWDGEGHIFDSFTAYEVKENEQIGPEFSAIKDNKGAWSFTPPSVVMTDEEIALANIFTAQSEHDVATSNINAIRQIVEDGDYEDSSEEEVRILIDGWTSYRIALRSYLKAADGSKELPRKAEDNN